MRARKDPPESVAGKIREAIEESVTTRTVVPIRSQLHTDEHTRLHSSLAMEADCWRKFASAVNGMGVIFEYHGSIDDAPWCVLVVAKQIH